MVDSLHFRRPSPAVGRLLVAVRSSVDIKGLLRDHSLPPSPSLSAVDGCEVVLEQRRLSLQQGIGPPRFEEVQESFECPCRHFYHDHILNHQH